MTEKDIYAICSQALSNSNLENDCKAIAKSVQNKDYNNVAQLLRVIIATSVTACICDVLEIQRKNKRI